MSAAMLHGLGDCTPALHCGCLRPETRERYAMEKLLTFVNARLDEEETLARAAIADDGGSTEGFSGQYEALIRPPSGVGAASGGFGEACARMIVTYAVPARVLRDVAAMRHVLELHYSWRLEADRNPDGPFHPVLASKVIAAEAVLRALASKWSDHPDYQEAVA